jgi:hypothetical protein
MNRNEVPNFQCFDFKKQPKSEKEEIEWLRNAIWMFHCQFEKRKEYRETKLKNEYEWLPLFTNAINDFEKKCKVVISSGWYLIMREYAFFPEAWNSLPFKLKIDKNWGEKL